MPPSSPPAGQAWKRQIDGRFTALRGSAALIVMLAHYQYLGLLPGLPVFKYSGQLGVMLFFFLSSFLLSHSLANAWERGTGAMQAIANYAVNRAFRIFPLLIVVVTLCYWRGLAFFPVSATYLEALRSSVTLGKAPSVLWTIPVELTFYIYLPAVLAVSLRAAQSPLGAAATIVAFFAWCVEIAVARRHGVAVGAWMTLGFHHYANSFIGGVLFYALMHNRRIVLPGAGAAIANAAPALFIIAVPFVHDAIFRRDLSMSELSDPAAWQAYYDGIFPFAPLLVGGVVYGILHPGETWLSRIMRFSLLRRVGELSFGLYLIHMPMIDLFVSTFGTGQPAFAAAIAATFALAAALSRFIEKPAIAFGRQFGQALLFRRATYASISRCAWADVRGE
jgi:peptidoglycan/LPS O-acetylase OafA/YrhL